MEEFIILLKDILSKYAYIKDKYINLLLNDSHILNNYKNIMIESPFDKELFHINTDNGKDIVNKFIKNNLIKKFNNITINYAFIGYTQYIFNILTKEGVGNEIVKMILLNMDKSSKNYDLSSNNDNGACVCKYPDAYSRPNHTCILKPCSNSAKKIKARTGAHGTCATIYNCSSCINDAGTNCNTPGGDDYHCQSWTNYGACAWKRYPISKGYYIDSDACTGGLQNGTGTGREVKYLKNVNYDTTETYCCTTFWGGNVRNTHRFIDQYSIASKNDATASNKCVRTNIGCNNCADAPRPQCPS
jgi:hypothetical protein